MDDTLPEVRYARSGDVHIAYQVLGEGDVDLVFVMGWLTNLETYWEQPDYRRFMRRLAGFTRLILFDKRGMGLSDHTPIGTLEERMDDVRAVMDAVGSERAVLLGVSEGAPLSMVFAAAHPEELGDRQWSSLIEQHHTTVRRVLAQYRGRELDTAGDGFFAAFDGPARGIRCAQAILDALGGIGIPARSGLHTGEVEVVGDKLAGIAVHTGARVAAAAGPGEVLVSSTVRDLVAGSGIEFEDRGLHELKGLEEPRRLFAVRQAAGRSA